ncbi:MAG TPA: carbonic anhydrase [Coxiellaceae bacterium]|nr:carbonic anhydrase [Coxiellaceae bacterium]
MQSSFRKLTDGYQTFRDKYAHEEQSLMKSLAQKGQQPEVMVVACCDSRVDPALLLQCEPGDLFVVRNVANIVPPFETDESHHGTSAALEFGVCYLHVKHLIIFGHSQCGGIHARLNKDSLHQDDFISRWTDLIATETHGNHSVDDYAKEALLHSYENCLTFPWIKEKLEAHTLSLHLWFLDIKSAEILAYDFKQKRFQPLASHD